MAYSRPHIHTLNARLNESPQFMIVVAGPRQIGKSFMVRQALKGRPSSFVATDQPLPTLSDPFDRIASTVGFEVAAPPTAQWIVEQWTKARAQAKALLATLVN